MNMEIGIHKNGDWHQLLACPWSRHAANLHRHNPDGYKDFGLNEKTRNRSDTSV